MTALILISGLLFLPISLALLMRKQQNMDLKEWNKENKKKFETYYDLKQHIRNKEAEVISEKKRLGAKYYLKQAELEEKEEAKLRAKYDENKIKGSQKHKIIPIKKDSFVKAIFSREGSLTTDIVRLKKLYKRGTLTKAEFEKAKNKLLK